jgi:glycerol-3-phosphate acyltransferase PlsY
MLQNLILVSISAFIFGSIPFGVVISRYIANIDITTMGSGNIGATNVARRLGIRWGIVTFVLDFLKGFIPVYLCQKIFAFPETGIFFVGLSALLGHQFSIFLNFRGGKGVSTILGVFLALSPVPTLIAIIIFLGIVYWTDFVSLASLTAISSAPVLLYVCMESMVYVMGSIVMAALIWLKHRDNIKRLRRGEERRWRKKPVT